MNDENDCFNCKHTDSEASDDPCKTCIGHRNTTREEFTKWEPITDSLTGLSAETLRGLLISQRRATEILIAEIAVLRKELAEGLKTRIK